MPLEFPKDANEVLNIIDLIGTLVFAISGAMAASSKKLDLFGAAFIAFVTAVGGGTIRDLLLGATPVGWMNDTIYIYVILCGVGITFLFKAWVRKLRKTLFLFDTIGIGVFTILGLSKALILEVPPIIAVIMGMFSAVLGGVIRDILINEIPLIFRKEIYAMACVAGGTLFILLRNTIPFEWNVSVTILTIIAIRIVVIKYKIGLSSIDDSKRRIFTKSE
ncbi:MAG: trimeric intracellular cation channel family protein [Flavobacteriales bacterium]|nr:trimeric intracellular cation channel family protein [Flavobacteriales bacterium]